MSSTRLAGNKVGYLLQLSQQSSEQRFGATCGHGTAWYKGDAWTGLSWCDLLLIEDLFACAVDLNHAR
eukprot:4069419-Amphidinium_carterae.1